MIDPNTKKIKDGLEKRLKIILARKKKQEREAYPILCQIYKLKGRCYPCEKQGMKQGECQSISPLCLRANGGK
jgi:hypothetical protein